MDLATPLMYLKGVGPARAQVLETKGLRTVADLLAYAPFRYEDRRNVKPITALVPGEVATVVARIQSAAASRFARRGVDLFEALLVDDSGGKLRAKWFHGGYLANLLVPGMTVALYGKVETDSRSRDRAILHPEFEVLHEDDSSGEHALHTGRIVPIYTAIGKITTRTFRLLIHRALEQVNTGVFDDPLPRAILEQHRLVGLEAALRSLHFPGEEAEAKIWNEFRSPAHFRLIYEEFFWLECGLALKRATARRADGIAFQLTAQIRERIKTMLPFKPTGAQKRVLGEIAQDMAAPHPMNRLLEGDVGSGKTLVAAEAAVIAIENGFQVALLAPTEILATQHYISLKRLFEKLGYAVVLLTGSSTKREKEQLKKLIAAGYAKLVVGTHAVLETDVAFQKLGLAIIDEQHRFGVMQRLKLVEKGVQPDVLVMTATPIPRTLALTVYGDLDTSVIDELPPGRKPVATRHLPENRIGEVWRFVGERMAAGEQAYVVYPAIEESETQVMKAAEAAYEELSKGVFRNFKVGLLHGKLKPDEKEAVMGRFQRGELHLLVATTVIEVGVDVPRATVMVIEHAERFGLAQLHQLRGRVGRGADKSYCILVTSELTANAKERMETLVRSNDGFLIAETDLKIRGPGEFFGTRQSGVPSLKIANLVRDREILEMARADAAWFTERPPSPEILKQAVDYIREHWQRRYGLVQIG
jgi:ATP-dependent DNA helicase RecG